MDFLSLLSTVATILLILATGFIGQKLRIIDDVMTKKMSSLIVKIGQPMLMLSALISKDCTRDDLKTGLLIFLLGMGTHTVIAVFARFFAKWIKDFDERKITEFSIVFANCGFIGFPVAKALLGDIGLFYGSFYIMSFYVFMWSWGQVILARGRSDIKITVLKTIVNPGTVPCYIGLAVLLLGIRFPTFVVDYTKYLADICTPVSVLITGALLATKKPRELFSDYRVYIIAVTKLLILPLLVSLLARVIGLPDYMVIFATIMAAMPSGAITSMFGEIYGIAPGYAAHIVGISSLFSPITIPVVMYVCQNVIMKI